MTYSVSCFFHVYYIILYCRYRAYYDMHVHFQNGVPHTFDVRAQRDKKNRITEHFDVGTLYIIN